MAKGRSLSQFQEMFSRPGEAPGLIRRAAYYGVESAALSPTISSYIGSLHTQKLGDPRVLPPQPIALN